MNTFIKKNEKFLRCSYPALRFSGWFLLVFSLCSLIVSVAFLRHFPSGFEGILKEWVFLYVTLVFLGLLGIGLSQLIRYLLDSDYKPGFILRHGDKFIYVYVVLTLIMAIRHFFVFAGLLHHFEKQYMTFLCISTTQMVYHAAKAFILLGVAQLLKRLMPIMDEHKSLV